MSFAKFKDYSFNPENPTKQIEVLPVDLIDAQVARKLYVEMTRLRRCQLALIDRYHPAAEMKCPVHFCVGQESIPATLSVLLEPADYLYSHHRSHGFYFAKVHGFKELFAEMFGKENGADGGKAGSQDVSMSAANFYSGAILAGGLPIAAGTAFAFKTKNINQCVVSAAGDGASDEGVYWESLNYAALKKLPLVFVCENNYFSTYSPQHHRNPESNISERAKAFGVKVQTFFGNDVVKSYLEIKNAIAHAKAGNGPVFIEAFTYRWNSHVGPEPDDHVGYRTDEEIQFWKRHCPIQMLENQLKARNLIDDGFIRDVQSSADQEIQEAFAFAEAGKFTTVPDWAAYNLSGKSPLGDQLLIDEHDLEFNQNQAEAIPGPY